ncbi:MAG: ChaN family lipoprotein, partial [Planctomycetes bacterium]|nr:ChaN family lipoprotein [Planctomycetota bacterium]
MRTALALSVAALVVCSAVARAQDRTLNLEIGDPARKGREAPVRLDGITDTATGAALSPAGLAGQLAGVQIVFVGESHTSIEFHNAQRRLIEELSRTGRQVLIGLEMYPSP